MGVQYPIGVVKAIVGGLGETHRVGDGCLEQIIVADVTRWKRSARERSSAWIRVGRVDAALHAAFVLEDLDVGNVGALV
ncbi:MAG: hypothetical protein MUP03_02620 [Anaerolineales bacterium]|nr:hypothetical protein [Anaerolineales bacterium]